MQEIENSKFIDECEKACAHKLKFSIDEPLFKKQEVDRTASIEIVNITPEEIEGAERLRVLVSCNYLSHCKVSFKCLTYLHRNCSAPTYKKPGFESVSQQDKGTRGTSTSYVTGCWTI